jgi:uncharacterized protein
MEILHAYHDNILKQVPEWRFRYLYSRMNWNQRLIAIKGPRGAGKTMLMLQRIKVGMGNPSPDKVLYTTADHHWFLTNNLLDTAEAFVRNGGEYLFIDELHRYPGWSGALKNIYDGFPGLRVVVSSSSALDLYRGASDLSRRLTTYDLPGLSFREYLSFSGQHSMDPLTLDELLKQHRQIALEINGKLRPIPAFNAYLTAGYLPLFMESITEDYLFKLSRIAQSVIESDLAVIEGYNAGTAYKVKKLLGVVAESVPFKPNIASLARKLDVSRDSIYNWLVHLNHAKLINFLHAANKGISLLQKPEKIYFENPNLAFAFRGSPNRGSIRETFLMNQLLNAGYPVAAPATTDFQVDDLLIELGGRSRKRVTSSSHENLIIAADDLEIGYGRKIPLWMFGLLY